jgi:hypothetical protein
MAKSIEFITQLPNWADEYIKYCLSHTKEVATGSGKIVKIEDRHIPTIAFFLHIWLPNNKMDTIHKDTYYEWLNGSNELKSDCIKKVDDKFKALASDIVANEGKGIFYAKNKLGWSDKQTQDINLTQVNANFGTVIQPPSQTTDNT